MLRKSLGGRVETEQLKCRLPSSLMSVCPCVDVDVACGGIICEQVVLEKRSGFIFLGPFSGEKLLA